MKVTRNELYNIADYDGLKICWVYNHAAASWRGKLPDQVQTWLGDPEDPKKPARKDLRHFPYYATFEENKPNLIKLNALQVNLLANLSAWSLTSEAGKQCIADAFGPDVVPGSAGARPTPECRGPSDK